MDVEKLVSPIYRVIQLSILGVTGSELEFLKSNGCFDPITEKITDKSKIILNDYFEKNRDEYLRKMYLYKISGFLKLSNLLNTFNIDDYVFLEFMGNRLREKGYLNIFIVDPKNNLACISTN